MNPSLPQRVTPWLDRARGFAFWMLVVSTPVSISGIEIGKSLFILSAILSFCLGPFWLGHRQSGWWNRVHLGLFTLLSLAICLSFLFAETPGTSARGPLRVLPVVASQWLLALGLMAFPISAPKGPWPLWALCLSMATAMAVSILGAHGERSHGLVGHPVVHGHLLSLMLTWTLVLGAWVLARRRQGPGRFWWALLLAIVPLLVLTYLDIRLNDSRSLLLPLVMVPALLLFFFLAKYPRSFLLFPVLSVVIPFALPATLIQKVERHLYSYYALPPQAVLEKAVWAQGELRLHWVQVPEGSLKVRLMAIPDPYEYWIVPSKPVTGPWTLQTPWTPPNGSRVVEITLFATRPGPTPLETSEKWNLVQKQAGETRLIPLGGRAPGDAPGFPWWRKRFSFFEDHRRAVWDSSLSISEHHPVFGVGPGNWRWAAKRPAENDAVYHLEKESGTDPLPFHGHNNLLTLAAESGRPTAVLYLLLCVSLAIYHFRSLYRARRQGDEGNAWWWQLAILCTFLVTQLMGLFDYTLFGVAGNIHWAAMGLLLGWTAWWGPKKNLKFSL